MGLNPIPNLNKGSASPAYTLKRLIWDKSDLKEGVVPSNRVPESRILRVISGLASA